MKKKLVSILVLICTSGHLLGQMNEKLKEDIRRNGADHQYAL